MALVLMVLNTISEYIDEAQLKWLILSSTSFQMDQAFWGVVSAAVEKSRHKSNRLAQGDWKFGPLG